MKKNVGLLISGFIALAISTLCTFPSAVKADGAPATTNISGGKYPFVNSDSSVTFKIKAPDNVKVQVNLGKTYDTVKDADGLYTVTTDPIVVGFHYYTLKIDGVEVSDSASDTFFGMSRDVSGIEIPEAGVDISDIKDVPHGDVREVHYFSKTTGNWRRLFVYTPPQYDADRKKKFPVLYLQHGYGEDETGWSRQGHMQAILDNLIADGKAQPMIVVMDNSSTEATRPAHQPIVAPPSPVAGGGPGRMGDFVSGFETVLTQETIPFIDSKFRTIANRDHRALAGLSMGGMQTFAIVSRHQDLFGYMGGFSGSAGLGGNFDINTSNNGMFKDADQCNKSMHVIFIGIGTAEPDMMRKGVLGFHDAITQHGIKTTFYESPGTAHEWLTWRRDLEQFAPLLFQK